jgi:sn-glycerol 3-phosphate transport system substrate-binding protein
VGGASVWIMQGKRQAEYEGAAEFLKFIASPAEQEWYVTATGYIPVTKTGFEKLNASGFYDKPGIKGREVAMQSLTYSEPNEITRGIRLGNFTQIRAEIRSELEAAFTGKKDMQAALDEAVSRGNGILRRFEQTFRGRELP